MERERKQTTQRSWAKNIKYPTKEFYVDTYISWSIIRQSSEKSTRCGFF